MDSTDVTQLPSDGVNKPASGTYGEGASLQRLKDSLPQPPPTAPGQPAAPPSVSPNPATTQAANAGGRPATSGPVPPGMPSALFAPTQNPNQPVGTPLAAPAVNPVQAAVTDQQKRLVLLDQLSNNPGVSDETREWAQTLIRLLTQVHGT